MRVSCQKQKAQIQSSCGYAISAISLLGEKGRYDIWTKSLLTQTPFFMYKIEKTILLVHQNQIFCKSGTECIVMTSCFNLSLLRYITSLIMHISVHQDLLSKSSWHCNPMSTFLWFAKASWLIPVYITLFFSLHLFSICRKCMCVGFHIISLFYALSGVSDACVYAQIGAYVAQ